MPCASVTRKNNFLNNRLITEIQTLAQAMKPLVTKLITHQVKGTSMKTYTILAIFTQNEFNNNFRIKEQIHFY